NDEQFRFEIVAADGRPKFDLALDHAPGDRRPDVLPSKTGLRSFGEPSDLRVGEPQSHQLLPRDVDLHAGLRSGVARTKVLLLWNSFAFPGRLVSVRQMLAKIVGEAPSALLAL